MLKSSDSKTLSLFSKNLARLRNEAGIPQIILAKRAGLTHNFVNDLENAKKAASFKTIDTLAATLGVEPLQFFIDPDQWSKKDNIQFLAVLDGLSKNITSLLDYHREAVQDVHRKPLNRK